MSTIVSPTTEMASASSSSAVSCASAIEKGKRSAAAAISSASNLLPSSTSAKNSSTAATATINNNKIVQCLPGSPMRWYFSSEKLRTNNPTVRSGIDAERELSYRQQASSFIHDLGTRLHLPHWVMNVAIVYMHRFYVFHSFKRFYKNDIAATALFLAAKVEEMPRKLEHVVKISHAFQHRDEPPLEPLSDKYFEEIQRLTTYETILLQTLAFDLNVEVPNSFVVKRIQELNAPRALAFAAYHFTTDSLHLTTLCLRYRPPVVACVCIYLASEWAKFEIPPSRGKPWYMSLDPEVTPELLKVLSDELVSVFERSHERIRCRRHLAAVKRDANGVVIPSSIMSEGNGMSLADLHDMRGSSGFPNSPVPPPLPVLPSLPPPPPSMASMFKLEASTSTENGAKISSVTLEMSVPSSSSTESPKKPRPETSKVDLKSYKERVKERELDKSRMDGGGNLNQQTPVVRKSFIPDMSSMNKESWDFGAGETDEKKTAASTSSSKPNDRSTADRRETSSTNHHHHQRSTPGGEEVSAAARSHHRREESHSKEERDRNRNRHSHNSEQRLSSTTVDGSRPRSRDHQSDRKSPHRHRPHREHGASSASRADAPQSLEAVVDSREQNDSASSTINNDHSRKRRHEDTRMTNGGGEKAAKLIDYEHGPPSKVRTIIDYEYGHRMVTDYGHGSRDADEFGYSQAKATSSWNHSANGSGEHSSSMSAANGTGRHHHWDGRDQRSSETSSHRPPHSRPSRPRNLGTAADAMDQHFQAIGHHLMGTAVIPKPSEFHAPSPPMPPLPPPPPPPPPPPVPRSMDNGHHPSTSSSMAGVSSIVGNRIPSDDILRQATQMANQMQKSEKWERLEKLKNTNFASKPSSGGGVSWKSTKQEPPAR